MEETPWLGRPGKVSPALSCGAGVAVTPSVGVTVAFVEL